MSMTDRGHTDPATQYVDRVAGYDQRLQMLERSHQHEPQTPVGAMVDWPGPAVPNLWMIADGRSLSTAAYPDLYAAIGTTWGGGSGSFNLPDMRGRVAVGTGTGAGLTARALAAAGGAETVSLTANQTGAHAHVVAITSGNDGPGHTHTFTSGNDTPDHIHGIGGSSGGASARHRHPSANVYNVQAGGSAIYGGGGGTAVAADDTPDHTHGLPAQTAGRSPFHQHPGTTDGPGQAHAHNVNGTTDAGGTAGAAHENMPPWRGVTKIIKVLPTTASSLT